MVLGDRSISLLQNSLRIRYRRLASSSLAISAWKSNLSKMSRARGEKHLDVGNHVARNVGRVGQQFIEGKAAGIEQLLLAATGGNA